MAALTYKKVGVDIRKADRLLDGLRGLIRSTHGSGVLRDRGQFAGLFQLPPRVEEPVLVSSADGVGTKLLLAKTLQEYASIGIDTVAMNTNDILVYGAAPLFFLDYIAMGTIRPPVFRALIRGMVRGCRLSGCVLLGGETAEMPGVYDEGAYDVAGFCVGVVARRHLLDGSAVRAGDRIIGLASSGVHANGFSLIRKVLSRAELNRWRPLLLRPTRIYVQPVLEVLRRSRGAITAIAHVTGGGVSRRLPSLVAKRPGLRAAWSPGRWPIPAIFRRIQRAGSIRDPEMFGTLNMGIGMALTCRPQGAPGILRMLATRHVQAWDIGSIERRNG